jgi:ABC-type glycerol-3-phosphate transport system substrate-binding protein
MPDVDLSTIPTLEIAYADCNNNLRKNIVAFNKAHTDVRIIEKNYAADGTDIETATRNLLNDILNGLYKPDIVTAETVNDMIVQLYRNNLYTDLYPLMGEELKNDLLGCVTRTFETDAGELWAVGTNLVIDTLVGPRKFLGDRTGWTVTEMIELAESLPEDVVLIEALCKQRSLSSWLGKNWHRLFIDEETNTCRFDSDEFIGLLEYLDTLPKTWEDANKLLADYKEPGVRFAPHQTGHVALAWELIGDVGSWVTREHNFFDSNLICIGYPTAEGQNGSTVDMIPYIITGFCEMPEAAWNFIESILLPDNFQTFGARLPALRSQVEQICTDAYELYWDVSPNGGIGGSTLAYADEVPAGQIRYTFTEQHEREFLDFLDNIAGQPVSTLSDDVIADILSEEITSLFGGAKTAEECARVIQSRVSIYLSENE